MGLDGLGGRWGGWGGNAIVVFDGGWQLWGVGGEGLELEFGFGYSVV